MMRSACGAALRIWAGAIPRRCEPRATPRRLGESLKGRRVTRRDAPGGGLRWTASAAGSAVAGETPNNVVDTRIPVTVGHSQTTLLNHILTKDHGKRIAVIENEKYNLEGTGDTIMMLNNGCLCCTVREDLVESLNALYERRDAFDHIMIETTGLANVSPIISTFYLSEQLPERVRLDGVVTVVDAKHIERHMNREPDEEASEAIEQIAYADRIILNKTDLVPEDSLKELEIRIRNINKMASVSKSMYAAVSVEYVLGIGGFDVNRVDEQLLLPEEQETHDHDHHDQGHQEEDHDHQEHQERHHHQEHQERHHHHHHHDDSVKSVNIMIEGDLALEKINTVLSAIVDMRGEDIFRMKGIVAIEGWKERFVFQGVHMLFEGAPDRLWRSEEKRITKMVFIGKNLDQNDFEEALLSCRA